MAHGGMRTGSRSSILAAMGSPTDMYGILGVPPSADATCIRAAYRRLAWIHHPDVGGSGHRMATLNEAWRVLRDPHERARYDVRRSAAIMAAAMASASTVPTRDRTATPPKAAARPSSPVPPPGEAPVAAGPLAASPAASRTSPPGPTVLDFGRYSGWSLAQLAERDPDYLEWLARTPIGRGLQREIRALLLRRACPGERSKGGMRPAFGGR